SELFVGGTAERDTAAPAAPTTTSPVSAATASARRDDQDIRIPPCASCIGCRPSAWRTNRRLLLPRAKSLPIPKRALSNRARRLRSRRAAAALRALSRLPPRTRRVVGVRRLRP